MATLEERHASRIDELVASRPPSLIRMPILMLDSGATHCMVSNPRILRNLRDLPVPVIIKLADGSRLTASQIGDIYTEDIKIKDVLLVPELKVNVVSVHQLARTDNISTTFRRNYAEMWKGSERVGGAIAIGELYYVRFLTANENDLPLYTLPGATRTFNSSAASLVPAEVIMSAMRMFWEVHFEDALTSLRDPSMFIREPGVFVPRPEFIWEQETNPDFEDALKVKEESGMFDLGRRSLWEQEKHPDFKYGFIGSFESFMETMTEERIKYYTSMKGKHSEDSSVGCGPVEDLPLLIDGPDAWVKEHMELIRKNYKSLKGKHSEDKSVNGKHSDGQHELDLLKVGTE